MKKTILFLVFLFLFFGCQPRGGGGSVPKTSSGQGQESSPGASSGPGSGSSGGSGSTVTPFVPSLNYKKAITLAGVPGVAGQSGSTDGPGATALFKSPRGLAVDSSGNIYVADSGNKTIRKITPAGVVSTIAGQVGVAGWDDGKGTLATFYHPSSIAIDKNNNLYVGDTLTVRKIDPSGNVTTLAGFKNGSDCADGQGNAAFFKMIRDIVIDDTTGNLYVADTMCETIRKITPAGVVSTFAGKVSTAGRADGTGVAATFSSPSSISMDKNGNIYVSDSINKIIRKITPTAVVTTIAGSGTEGHLDGAALSAQFSYPAGIAIDSNGNFFIADIGVTSYLRNMISGNVGTLSEVSTEAFLNKTSQPSAVAIDKSNILYVITDNAIVKMTE